MATVGIKGLNSAQAADNCPNVPLNDSESVRPAEVRRRCQRGSRRHGPWSHHGEQLHWCFLLRHRHQTSITTQPWEKLCHY